MVMSSTRIACKLIRKKKKSFFSSNLLTLVHSTPWLTTRRRTCPICKGDVVRSLAHGSPSSPRYEPYQDDSDEEADGEASASTSRSREANSDLEQGVLTSDTRDVQGEERTSRYDGWLRMWSHNFGSRSRGRSPSAGDNTR